MNKQLYDQLQTEMAALDELLEIVPEEAVIDRISIEKRKNLLERELETNPPPQRWPFAARIAFDGTPVLNSQGINANFGGDAMTTFAKLITSLAASQVTPLGERGVIPNQDSFQIAITGTSPGSFAFEIEEVPDQQISYLEAPTPVEVAIQQATEIMKSSTGEAESLAEAIEETDNRALGDMRAFIRILADSDATCSLSFEGESFRFDSASDVQKALNNLSQDNVVEGEVDIRGHFQGYLPKVRRAEFVNEDTQEIIMARVDRVVHDAERINSILGENVSIRARTRRVGSSSPRYTILQF